MKVQTHVSSEDGKYFDVSFNSDYVSFEIIEMKIPEITQMLEDIKAQVFLLKEAYKTEWRKQMLKKWKNDLGAKESKTQ